MTSKWKRRMVIGAAYLLTYCLFYVALRSSHILVHRRYVIMKPGETNDKAGFTYWVINDVGHRPFLDAVSLRPKKSLCDRLLRAPFWPLEEAEGLLWTLRERSHFGGG